MERLTLKEITEITKGKSLYPIGEITFPGVSIDSRTLRKGELFIPIKGTNHDGHSFVKEVIQKGAGGVLIEEGHPLQEKLLKEMEIGTVPIVFVNNTLSALQKIAAYHRRKFRMPVVGITGSNGKTTTKEMAWYILSHKISILKNEGNLNNHIGVPLTLLRLDASYHGAIIEMGISNKGELTRLCEIAAPTGAVITNVGPAHLEKFGRIENVAEAKCEILDFIDANGFCVLNRDDKFFDIFKSKTSARIITFGMSNQADVYPEHIEIELSGRVNRMSFRLIFPLGNVNINIHVIGIHNLYNALCATATAFMLGARIEDIKHGLEKFRPVKMRSVVEVIKGISIINDTYNANPASMVAAIDTLVSFRKGKQKIAILGDMLELGENAIKAHRDLGIYAASVGVDKLIAIGEFSEHIATGAIEGGMGEESIIVCRDPSESLENLKSWLSRGDILLVKGSRGMGMETIVNTLKASL